MSKITRYYPISGANFTDFSVDYTAVTLAGESIFFKGTSQPDHVYLSGNFTFDFTDSGTSQITPQIPGYDKLFLAGRRADYTAALQGETLRLSGTNRPTVIMARGDFVVFQDGQVETNAWIDALVSNSAAPATDPSVTATGSVDAMAAQALDNATPSARVLVYALGSEGATFARVQPGMRLEVKGSSGVDKVYVKSDSIVDFTDASTGDDVAYLTGRLSEYTITSAPESVVVEFTRGTERLRAAGSDWIVFADGMTDLTTIKGLLDADPNRTLSINDLGNAWDPNTRTSGLSPLLNLDTAPDAMDGDYRPATSTGAWRGAHLVGANAESFSLPGVTVGGDLTFSAWVKPTAITSPSNRRLLELGNAAVGNGNGNLMFSLDVAGKLNFKYFDPNGGVLGDVSTAQAVLTSAEISAGSWLHLGFAVQANNSFTFFKNGVAVGSGTLSSAIPSLARANSWVGKSSFGNAYDGGVRDVRVYDSARTAAQLTADMSGSLDTSEASLRLAFALDGRLEGYSHNGATPAVINPNARATFSGASPTYVLSDTKRIASLDHPNAAALVVGSDALINRIRLDMDGLRDGASERLRNADGSMEIPLGSSGNGMISLAGQSWNYTYAFAQAGHYDGGQLTLSLAGDAIVSTQQAQTVLRHLTYHNTAANLTGGERHFTVALLSNTDVLAQANVVLGIGTRPAQMGLAAGFVINGECAGDQSGYSASSAGDVNGDGLADLMVGAPGKDGAAAGMGCGYVVFGKLTTQPTNLSDVALGTGGFVITGQCAADQAGWCVGGAGDVNGDGLQDLLVGAPQRDPAAGPQAGRSYVVFGKTSTTAVDLSIVAAGTGGFLIKGQDASDWSGYAVSQAGDVNGDHLGDLLIAAPGVDPATTGTYPGRSYVVFGKTATTAIDLSAVAAGSGGFVINGQCAFDQSGCSLSGAGDVNGDGLADLIVGARQSDGGAASADAGRSYVVFGKSTTLAVELSALATGGFMINGQDASDGSGASVSGAGDVNGDGLADLIVGAPHGDPSGGANAGESYVVFGKTATTTTELTDVAAGTGGFVIHGENASDLSGASVSGAGDVNGDGLADLIVGAPQHDPGAAADAGRSYVVFGKTTTLAIDLSAVAAGTGGFAINGAGGSDALGASVASAGDLNGDGLADLLAGAPNSDPMAGANAGRTYVIFGKTDTAPVHLSAIQADSGRDLEIDWLGTSASESWTGSNANEWALGGAGDDTLIGGGGVDVLCAGAGDDTIVLNPSNIAEMEKTTPAAPSGLGRQGSLARIDGGGGIDTLRLSAGASLDFTAIANVASGHGGLTSRIANIERLDLATDSTPNTLRLSGQDVIDLCKMNLFNTGKGWVDSSGLALGSTVARHQLAIQATATDTIDIELNEWTPIVNAGAAVLVTDAGATPYEVWNHNTKALQLLIQQGAQVI